MASLLGPFHFGKERHAFFQVRVHIHELTNVPLLEGSFKAKWKIDHTHQLANAAAASTNAAQSIASASKDGGDATGAGVKGVFDALALRRHRSNSTLASQATGKSAEKDVKAGRAPQKRHGSIDATTGGSSLRDPYARSEADSEDAQSVHRAASIASSNAPRPSFMSHVRGILQQSNNDADSRSSSPMPISPTDTRPGSRSTNSPGTSYDRGAEGGSGSPELARSVDDAGTQHRQDSRSRRVSARDYAASHDTSMSRHQKRPSTGQSSQQSHSTTYSSENHSTGKGVARAASTKSSEHDSRHNSRDVGQVLRMPEPRGETHGKRVKEHRVCWERQIEVGVRVPIEKQRNMSKPSTPASGESSVRRQGSHRDLTSDMDERSIRKEKSMDFGAREAGSGRKGLLGHAELRISVRGEVPTERHHSSSSVRSSDINMGYINVNLAEFAPYPSHKSHDREGHNGEGGRGQHRQHHHHHHHHHHAPSRTETRRYLLRDGPTNATLKITVEMTHAGGSLDYTVPRNKTGMMMTSAITPEMEKAQQQGTEGATSSNSSTSEKDGNAEGGESTTGDVAERRRSSQNTASTNASRSMTKKSVANISHKQRIPAANLTTELTHHDAARAIKEISGGDRLALSFSAAAHHERAPEDIIDLLFDPKTTAEQLSRLVASGGLANSSRRQNKGNTAQQRGSFAHWQGPNNRPQSAIEKSTQGPTSSSDGDATTQPKPRRSLPAYDLSNRDERQVDDNAPQPTTVSRRVSRTTTVRWNDQVDSAEPSSDASEPRDTSTPRFLEPSASAGSLHPGDGRVPVAASPLSISPDLPRDKEESVDSELDLDKALPSHPEAIQV